MDIIEGGTAGEASRGTIFDTYILDTALPVDSCTLGLEKTWNSTGSWDGMEWTWKYPHCTPAITHVSRLAFLSPWGIVSVSGENTCAVYLGRWVGRT